MEHLRQQLHSFGATTGIHGLSNIIHASHWVESVFWSVLFLGAVYLTLNDCSYAIKDYINEVTTLSAKIDNIEADGEGLRLTEALLCVSYKKETVNEEFLSVLPDLPTVVEDFEPIRYLKRLSTVSDPSNLTTEDHAIFTA